MTKNKTEQPENPQINGLVERVNRTIKTATILKTTFKTLAKMEIELNKFLVFYNTEKRHGRLQQETQCRTTI